MNALILPLIHLPMEMGGKVVVQVVVQVTAVEVLLREVAKALPPAVHLSRRVDPRHAWPRLMGCRGHASRSPDFGKKKLVAHHHNHDDALLNLVTMSRIHIVAAILMMRCAP